MRLIVCMAAAIAAVACLASRPVGPAVPELVAANLSRDQIRSMPILERPDRPIHFYGNAVRRRHRQFHGQAPVRPAQPR